MEIYHVIIHRTYFMGYLMRELNELINVITKLKMLLKLSFIANENISS